MEGVFFILIGAALFSQSWYVLGLYSEGRTMGIFVGGLGVLSLAAIALAPMLLIGKPTGTEAAGESAVLQTVLRLLTGQGRDAAVLAETTMLKSLILGWAMYSIAVGAHGLWDFDERAIGFYSAILAVVSLIGFIFYAGNLQFRYSNAVWLGMSGATLALTVLAGIMFFYLAFSFNVLRLVTGWFILVGGGVVAAIGLAMVSTAIT